MSLTLLRHSHSRRRGVRLRRDTIFPLDNTTTRNSSVFQRDTSILQPHFALFWYLPTSIIRMRLILLCILATWIVFVLCDAPVIHFTISRRGGPTRTSKEADLSALAEAISRAETKYGLTRREVKGNKLVRKPKLKAKGGKTEQSLMTQVGEEGRWCVLTPSWNYGTEITNL
jgi:hypothetical protein